MSKFHLFVVRSYAGANQVPKICLSKQIYCQEFFFTISIKKNLEFMSGSSHIGSVLIGIEFWMFIYFLLFGLGTLKKRIYRLVTRLASSKLQVCNLVLI